MNLIHMVSDDGFLEEFWTELQARRKEDPTVSRKEVYEAMEAAYSSFFDCYRFPSYDAFRKFLVRKTDNNPSKSL